MNGKQPAKIGQLWICLSEDIGLPPDGVALQLALECIPNAEQLQLGPLLAMGNCLNLFWMCLVCMCCLYWAAAEGVLW